MRAQQHAKSRVCLGRGTGDSRHPFPVTPSNYRLTMAATATLVSHVPPKSKTPASAVWSMISHAATTVKRGPLRQKLYVLGIEFCK